MKLILNLSLKNTHCLRRDHPRRKQADKTEYVQGPLSESPVLRSLQTSKKHKSSKTVQSESSVDSEAEITFEESTVDFDDGWFIEEIDDETETDFELESEDEQIDFRTDPRFQELPNKVIQGLESHQKELKSLKTKKPQDESSLETRTTAIPHRKLRIISGDFGGRRLLSPKGHFVRPMMERVRSAIFDMLFANLAGVGSFPSGSRWLDLYAGTGAVGLEAISRGCEEAHFIEMDQWVVSTVLRKNIEELDCVDRASIRTMVCVKVEDYLDRLIKLPEYSTGPFDFVSVCPPYLQVSYPELQKQLNDSGVLHDNTIIFMEYPRQLSREVQQNIGNLEKIKDRAYGRTHLAVYGPPSD
eukprot:g4589.t1